MLELRANSKGRNMMWFLHRTLDFFQPDWNLLQTGICGKQAKRNCVCEKAAAETDLHATNCLSASVRHSPLPHVNIVQSLSDLSKHIRGLQWRHQGFNIYKAQNRNDGNDGNDRNHTTESTKYDQLWSNHITYAKVLCGYMCVFHCFPLYWRLRLI